MKRVLILLVFICILPLFSQVTFGGTEQQQPQTQKPVTVPQRKSREIDEELRRLLDEYVSGLIVSTIGEHIVVVKGTIKTESSMLKVKEILKVYGSQVIDLIDYKVSPQLFRVDATIVILDKSSGDEFKADLFGIVKDASIGFDANALNWGVQLDLSKISDILNYWVISGKADIKSYPSFLVENKGECKFQIGGEVPYQYSTKDGVGIEFKPYGVIIKVSPELRLDGNVSANIEFEVSKPDFSSPLPSGQVGYLKKYYSSKLTIKPNKSICIGGFEYEGIESNARSGCIIPFPFFKNINEKKILYLVLSITVPATEIDNKVYEKKMKE